MWMRTRLFLFLAISRMLYNSLNVFVVCFVLIRNNLLPWTECSSNNNKKTVYKVIEYKKKTKTTFGYTHN